MQLTLTNRYFNKYLKIDMRKSLKTYQQLAGSSEKSILNVSRKVTCNRQNSENDLNYRYW